LKARSVTADVAYPLICSVVRKIPRGKVASYAQVAYAAGLPGRARMVGRALSDAGPKARLPWHRVVNAQGCIALPKSSAAYLEQKARLLAEGIEFAASGRISFARFGWKRDPAPILD
tara:strand:- start:1436 stop:1786 length:351 start_codon:yes stop_codon:yes gene_type:complete